MFEKIKAMGEIFRYFFIERSYDILYNLFIKREFIPKEKRDIGIIEKKKLNDFFSELLEEINYPNHKKENTKIMFRRVIGRSMPSKWEYHTLMGVLSRTLEKIRTKK